MASKKSFVMYTNWAQMLYEMPDEQAGKLIKAISAYALEKEVVIDDPVLMAVFTMIKGKLDEDRAKYDEKVERIANINKAKRNRNDIGTTTTRNRNEIAGVTDNDTDTVINFSVNKGKKNKFHNFNERDNHGIQEALLKKQWN